MTQRYNALLLTLALTGLLVGCCPSRNILSEAITPATYTLTLDANGGTLAQGTDTTQQVASGSRATRPVTDPTRMGYDFAGWTTSQNGGATFDFAGEPITTNLTLYAWWSIKTYTIAFDASGGSPAPPPQQVNHGRQATPPADPARTGYTFGGWTRTRDGADTFTFTTETVTANLTLYAKWNVTTHTVTFDANGGQGNATRSVNYGDKATPPTDPTRTGYSFLGWATTPNGTDTFDFANTSITVPLTLYAKWQINNAPAATYTLTLDANGGTLAQGTNAAQQLASGDRATPPADPTRTGFTFVGWTKTRDGADTFDFTAETVTANLTLYAKWQINNAPAAATYTLTFDVNGGTLAQGTNATQQLASGDRATPPTNPFRTGFTFGGWTKTRDGADTFDFTVETVTAVITLYAKWNVIRYTVTLSANGGSPTSTQTVNYGDTAMPPATNPTRTGYTFVDWTFTRNGTDSFDFNTPITAPVMLYAKWNMATYTITFDANGGTLPVGVSAVQQVPQNGQATPPADPTRARTGQWDFALVYWSADKRTRFDFNAPVTQAMTLYAMWSVSLPDDNFRDKLKTIVPSAFDGDRLVVSHADVTGLTYMGVAISNISNLSGIEFFTDLTVLGFGSNQLTSVDVSRNTALTWLDCTRNQLTALDVSRNTALTRLECGGNQLTALDVSRNTALTALDCNNNQLTALDVSRNTALTFLSCDSNQLTALDVSRNTALTVLACGDNQLTTLDVSRNTALTGLACGDNQLTALDVSRNTALTNLACDDNQLTALDVSQNTALIFLTCNSNQLTALDVSRNTALTQLECGFNQLTGLDVSRNTALTSLICIGNRFTSLDISGMRSASNLSLGSISNLAALKVHTNLKDHSEVYSLKNRRGTALTIEVYDAPAGSTNYTKTCSSYQPGNNTAGTCLIP